MFECNSSDQCRYGQWRSRHARSRARSAFVAMASLISTGIASPFVHGQDDKVFWARPEFIIPFQVDANGTPPREVILEASDDNGDSWYVVSRGDIRTRQFRFQAPQNGDYQFRLKMVDDAGRKFNNPGPPLRIHVDTEKPIGKLVIDMNERGDLQAKFRIADPNLDLESIKLEYQTEESQEWQRIRFQVNESGNIDEWAGDGTWSIAGNTRQLVVRLTAKDRAGNAIELTRVPDLPKTAKNSMGMQFASQPRLANKSPDEATLEIGSGVAKTNDLPRVQNLGQVHLSNPSPTVGNGAFNQTEAQQLLIEKQQKMLETQQKMLEIQLQSQRQIAESKALDDQKFLSSSIASKPEAISSRNESGVENSFPISHNSVPRGEKSSRSILQSQPSASPIRELSNDEFESLTNIQSKQDKLRLADAGNTSSKRGSSAGWGDDSSTNRLIENAARLPKTNGDFGTQRSGFPSTDLDMSPSFGAPRAGSDDPMFVASRSFSLEYGIDNDMGAQVRNVELWGTTDGGATWEIWGNDPDRTSPFDIEVESDGRFGFRMVIVGANGLASNRPHNGDDADAWVQVDTKQPRVKIQSALYGQGPEVGSLVIEYSADDSHLGERPISLYFAVSPDGPWQEIATALRNTGRFAWAADPNLPPAIYLKVRAVDSAGNQSEQIMDVPVKVQGIAPRGRIRGIGPGIPGNRQ